MWIFGVACWTQLIFSLVRDNTLSLMQWGLGFQYTAAQGLVSSCWNQGRWRVYIDWFCDHFSSYTLLYAPCRTHAFLHSSTSTIFRVLGTQVKYIFFYYWCRRWHVWVNLRWSSDRILDGRTMCYKFHMTSCVKDILTNWWLATVKKERKNRKQKITTKTQNEQYHTFPARIAVYVNALQHYYMAWLISGQQSSMLSLIIENFRLERLYLTRSRLTCAP